jgi:hypothetical protein
VDQAVFAGRPPEEIADLILEGALRVGEYPGGLLVLGGALGPRIAASRGGELLRDSPAPPELVTHESTRLDGPQMARVAGGAGLTESLYLVPLSSAEAHLGNLVLFDKNGPTPDDLLMEAYASRAAAALRHATTG